MATLAHEFSEINFVGAVEGERLRQETIDAPLRAAQRLTQASSAILLSFDRQGGVTSIVASTSHTTAETMTQPGIRAAIESATAWMVETRRPLWVDAPTGGGATLIVKVAERGATALLLALEVDGATAMMRARVAKLAPDLVVLLGSCIDLETSNRALENHRAAALAALDLDDGGVIAVRADHTVVFANAAASAMLTDGSVLQLRRGALRAACYGDGAPFQAALDAVAESTQAARANSRRAFVMLLKSPASQASVIVAITPASQSTRALADEEAVAIVQVLAADGVGRSAIEALCQLHGLSRVETRLVGHLCAGMTVSDAATEMRVKVETARSYLKQVFSKTGTRRQTDLTLLINRYARAVQGRFDFRPA